MKTPMRELIEKLKQEIENQVQFRTEFEDGVVQGLEEALDLAEDMLEKEKDTMKSCIVMGFEFIPVNPNYYNEDAELLYNETFNTK